MEKMTLYLVIYEFLLSISVVFAKHEQYDGHSLYQVNVINTEEAKIINNLVNQFYLDVWSHAIPGRPGYILVPKEGKEVFEISLNAGGINYEIKIYNIRDLLKLEDQQLRAIAVRNQRHKNHRKHFEISFDTVYNYNEIYAYLRYLAKTYSYVTNVKGGTSFEGRPIYYLKISTTEFQDNKKPIVMLQSLLHSREWVTSPVTLYTIHNLVVARTEPDLLEKIDWIIIPVVNPDGYIYSHEIDRFWRKNRRTGITARNVCSGVDLNRNFNVNWGTDSSDESCSAEFHGSKPLSEPESRVISNIMRMYKDRIALYLDLHSYGSMIVYGYGNGTLTRNYYTVNEVGVMMAKAIDKVKVPWSPKYVVGNVATVMYTISGSASDFAQQVGIPLSYSYELPGGNNTYGFLVTPKTIAQTSFETWHGIVAGAKYILNKTNSNNIYGPRFNL